MKSPFIKYGVIYGVVSIIVSLVVYMVSPALFAEWWLGLALLIIPIFFMSQAVKETRSAGGGHIDFGSAFVQGFGTFMVGLIISTIFSYLLYNVIDPGLEDVIKEQMAETMSGFEELLGEEAFDQMLEEVESKSLASPGALLQGILGSGFFGAIISLIIAAIMKKNRPMIDTLDDQV